MSFLWAKAEKCNCGDSINISGMMDHLWLTAPQHGTCNQKYDLFHNKISKFVFWRNCYWKPRQGNIYRNSFGEIYIRDKPKYLTLNSNNLNNYRYSEINNFFTMDYAECFDISPILDPSWKCCTISFFSAWCCKKYHIIRYDDIRVLCRRGLSCQFLLMYAAQYATLNVSIAVLMICE